MKIYIGADHRGFTLKEAVKVWLIGEGHDVIDCGNTLYDTADDFVDFAFAVADEVVANTESRGILFCGSAGGMTIAANKVPGIRSAPAMSILDVVHNRDHNDMNVLTIASELTTETQAKEYIHAFLTTPFLNEERLIRRLRKIAAREG